MRRASPSAQGGHCSSLSTGSSSSVSLQVQVLEMAESEKVWRMASIFALSVANMNWLYPMMSRKEIPGMSSIEYTTGTQKVVFD